MISYKLRIPISALKKIQTLDVKTVTVQHTQIDVVFLGFSILIVTINKSQGCFLRVFLWFENPNVDVELL